MPKSARYLWLGVVKLLVGLGGFLLAFYFASDMVAHETLSIPPVAPPSIAEVLSMVLSTAAAWGGLLLLGFLIASGINSLSQYRDEHSQEILDNGRPGGH